MLRNQGQRSTVKSLKFRSATRPHQWDVSVKNVATGEVVLLHLDKTTQRKEKAPDPALGDMVVVKYDDHSKHAFTFLKDGSPSPNPTP